MHRGDGGAHLVLVCPFTVIVVVHNKLLVSKARNRKKKKIPRTRDEMCLLGPSESLLAASTPSRILPPFVGRPKVKH